MAFAFVTRALNCPCTVICSAAFKVFSPDASKGPQLPMAGASVPSLSAVQRLCSLGLGSPVCRLVTPTLLSMQRLSPTIDVYPVWHAKQHQSYMTLYSRAGERMYSTN